jgi:hypothetical protein
VAHSVLSFASTTITALQRDDARRVADLAVAQAALSKAKDVLARFNE